MEGESFSKCGSRLRAAHSFYKFATASLIEDNPFPKCDSHRSAAHILSKNVQELHGLRIIRFQHVALALAPRTF
eukprot:3315963-Pyramimonas_sp.AAC.1